jgi:hypothetical protein
MYVQSAEQNGGYTDQKTIITEYGWTSAMCVSIREPYAMLQNMDI